MEALGTVLVRPAPHPLRRIWNSERLPEAFLFVIAAAPFGIGGTLIALPQTYRASATLRGAFVYADPWLWGMAMVTLAVVVAATAILRRESAIWSCIGLTLVWFLWGIATLPAVTAGRGVPSGPIIYTVFAFLTALSGVLARIWHTRTKTTP